MTPTGLTDLLLEVTGQGYDVTITTRRRVDGKAGDLSMPSAWARRLGYQPSQQAELPVGSEAK